VPGLLAAGLAQSGCANHFAGFHIGLCIGNGWVAGRSAIEDLDRLPPAKLDAAEVQALYAETKAPLRETATAESDRILRDLQTIMFSYDVGILKHSDRLQRAFDRVSRLAEELNEIAAPHTHELVRLKETEAMLVAARLILGASLFRTESRLSHFRDDFQTRDDANWLVWVDVAESDNGPAFAKTPVPTPYCSVVLPRRKPSRLAARRAVEGL
jgi:succinate dehydrogenase/fumarate reductase flavoprotein subunit